MDIQRRRAAVDRICYYFRRVLKEYPTSIRRPNGEAAGGYHSISNLFPSKYVCHRCHECHKAHHCQGRGLGRPLRYAGAGDDISELIEEMIEHEKKRRLLEDITRIQETEGLVEISR